MRPASGAHPHPMTRAEALLIWQQLMAENAAEPLWQPMTGESLTTVPPEPALRESGSANPH